MLDRGTYDADGEAAKRRALAKVVATSEGDHWIWQGAGAKSYGARRHVAPERPVARTVLRPRPVMMLKTGDLVSPAVVLSCSSLAEMVKWRPATTCHDRRCVNPDHHTFEPRTESKRRKAARPDGEDDLYATHAEYGTVRVLCRKIGMAWIFSEEHGLQEVVQDDEITDVRTAA